MKKNLIKLIVNIFLIYLINIYPLNAEVLKKFKITGNERISNDTIELFSGVTINENINKIKLNQILKDLYDTDFFKNIKINFEENTLYIELIENPIIENINYNGIKANKILDAIKENALTKSRYSFNDLVLKKEKLRLKILFKELGYYTANVEILVEEKKNNLVDLIFNIELGEKAKIKKITFIGNKIFKDRKLRRLISSEEYKFWKFISGKKFLNERQVELDVRLIRNFYINNGYYNVKVNSSFATLLEKNEFNLV